MRKTNRHFNDMEVKKLNLLKQLQLNFNNNSTTKIAEICNVCVFY